MSREILTVVETVSNEKGLNPEDIFEAIEQALVVSTKKKSIPNSQKWRSVYISTAKLAIMTLSATGQWWLMKIMKCQRVSLPSVTWTKTNTKSAISSKNKSNRSNLVVLQPLKPSKSSSKRFVKLSVRWWRMPLNHAWVSW